MQESIGLAVGGLVLGIASIVFAFIYTWIGLALGIVGIVLSAMAMKRCPSAKGLAIGGLVCAIVGTVLNVSLVACALCVVGSVLSAAAVA